MPPDTVTLENTERKDQSEVWSVEQHLRLLRNEPDLDKHDVSDGDALQLPKWFDPDKFKRGQQFFNNNYFALFVSKLCGLVVILTVPQISNTLIMTNKSSEPKTAFKRYLSTIAHMKLWYNGKVDDTNSWAYKSLSEVFKRHVAASNRGKREGKGPVSQASLALTQFGFVGFGVLMPEKLGIVGTDEDFAAFLHFWRTIGYMVGIQDRYNICRDSLTESRQLFSAIVNEMFAPTVKEPTADFNHLAVALLKGMWAIVPNVDAEGFMAYTKHMCGLEVERCSNWYSQFMFNFQIWVHTTLLGSKWFGAMWRTLLNWHMRFTLIAVMKFPLLARFAFGLPIKSVEM